MARAFGTGDIVEYRRTSAPLQAWLTRGTRGRVVERVGNGRGFTGAIVVDFGAPFRRVYVDAGDIRRIRIGSDGRDVVGGGRRARTRRTAVPFVPDRRRKLPEIPRAARARSSEAQGPGRRYWFDDPADARRFASAKRDAGYVVLADESEWDDPDAGPSVWIGRPSADRVADVVAGIDPAAL